MARTAVTPATPGNAYSGAMTALTFAAADATNFNKVALSAREVLIAYNSGGSTYNVTITSVDDPCGRQENITETIAAGAYKVFVADKIPGWQQTDGQLYFQADNVAVKFAVVRLP